MKQKCLFGGARFLKHGRSSASSEPLQVEQQEDDKWNNYNTTTTKVATTDHHQPGPAAAPFLFGSNFHSHSHSLFPEGEQMLSFSSSSSTSTATTSRPNANANVNALMLSSINGNDGSIPIPSSSSSSSSSSSYSQYYSQFNPISSSSAAPSSFYRNATAGIISGSSNVNVNMNMNMNMQQQQQGGGVRGPFTPSQWMELEYQALIYKHIDDNVPVPPSLLIPIRRRSINQSTLSNYPPAGSFRSNTPLGWGSCNGNVDPEPGRCRRTDGKKWRCSRDAVADQKYCERHMNRGRHRSRKLVEGHSGQLASSKTIPPLMINISSQHSTSAVSSGSGSGPIFLLPQAKCLQPNFSDPSSPSSQLNRIVMSEDNLKESIQDSQGLSLLTAVSTKPAGNNSLVPPILKHHNNNNNNNNPFEAHDSLKYPLRSSFSENISSFDYYYSSQLEEDRNNHHPHPLRHFIDDWPKTQPEHQPIRWPELELEDMKSDRDRTQLSSATDFSSSTSSPNQEKLALSPLRLSSWIPIISWEFPTILGGPLGEALTNTNSSSSRAKDLNFSKNYSSSSSSSSLNHLTSDGWDSSSPRLDSSPTGVLQKTSTIGSLSSSTGSSPTRADSLKVFDSSSNMCDDDLLGSYTLNI